MIINKKIKRTIIKNKSQYIGSILLIMISCLLFIMFNLLYLNLEKSNESFKKNYVQEDANFMVQNTINNISDIESKFNVTLENCKTFDYNLKNNIILRLFSENKKVNIPAIIEGSPLKNNNDILLDPAFAKAQNIKIGDYVKIYKKNFKVSGFMSIPNYIYTLKSETDLVSNPKIFGIGIISKDTFVKLNKGNIFYSIKFNKNIESTDTVKSNLKKYLNENNTILSWTNKSENARISYVNAKIKGIKQTSTSMPLAILLLTCILVGIVMSRMIKQQFTTIGTLYSIGYKKEEIMRHYLMYPIVIAIIGNTLGILLGLLTVNPMINYIVTYFNIPVTSLEFSIKYIFISFALPFIFLIPTVYIVVNKGLKYSPVELINGGKNKNRINIIEKNLNLKNMKFKTKFRIREIIRNIPRSLFLLIGVIFATMLLLIGFVSQNSIKYLIDDTFNNVYKYKYDYILNSIYTENSKYGEPYMISEFTYNKNTNIKVYGININSNYIVLKDKNSNKIDYNKTIITKSLAEKLNLKEGSSIEITNKLNSKKYNITIDKIGETYVGENIYMPINKLNTMLNYPNNSYRGLWSNTKLDLLDNIILLQISKDDLKKSFDSIIKPLKYSMGTIGFLAFVIGLIVIYVVTSLIIEENRENISLMKILGYHNKEIYLLILNSNIFLVIIGYIVGVPLNIKFMNTMFKAASKDTNFVFPIIINNFYAILGFLVILFTYEISIILNRRKVNKISMSEFLKLRKE